MTTRSRRRRERRARRRRTTLFVGIVGIVGALLIATGVTFAPLVNTTAPAAAEDFDLVSIPDFDDTAPDVLMAAPALSDAAVAQVSAVFVAFVKGVIMHDHWLHIGRCEQPGSGYGGVDWQGGGTNRQGLFMGGLGISAQAWAENAWDMPADGRDATWGQQMIVATRIYAYAGPGGWGCK